MENMIEISHISKSFGDVKAVQDLSFRVKRGELFAFLGVNGAGKSTSISIMCGKLTRDSGTVVIDGKNLDKEADAIEAAVKKVLEDGFRTGDIYSDGCEKVGCAKMGDLIAERI